MSLMSGSSDIHGMTEAKPACLKNDVHSSHYDKMLYIHIATDILGHVLFGSGYDEGK